MNPDASARALIMKTDGRLTAARVRVLSCLLVQTQPCTHHEIESMLAAEEPMDRVTLYRVLDWLVEQSLAHKVSGEGQASRFRSGDAQTSHQHAHFECTSCSTLTCLEGIAIPSHILPPAGFHLDRSEFLLKGLCPACN
ncbi:MAG: transcriptional repressor [Pseudomonadota bacterium]